MPKTYKKLFKVEFAQHKTLRREKVEREGMFDHQNLPLLNVGETVRIQNNKTFYRKFKRIKSIKVNLPTVRIKSIKMNIPIASTKSTNLSLKHRLEKDQVIPRGRSFKSYNYNLKGR